MELLVKGDECRIGPSDLVVLLIKMENIEIVHEDNKQICLINWADMSLHLLLLRSSVVHHHQPIFM